jgi:hypothetical protein
MRMSSLCDLVNEKYWEEFNALAPKFVVGTLAPKFISLRSLLRL